MIIRKPFLILAIMMLGAFTLHAQTTNARIEVTISNIGSDAGSLIIGLYKSPENFLKKPVKGLKLAAIKGEVSAIFENIEPGTYAISLFHDQNDNKKLDVNFLGIPKEPYATSNNAKNMFGPPQWEDAKFSVSKGEIIKQKIIF